MHTPSFGQKSGSLVGQQKSPLPSVTQVEPVSQKQSEQKPVSAQQSWLGSSSPPPQTPPLAPR
jgi:hypothetical protein